jgi:hypothetical protein
MINLSLGEDALFNPQHLNGGNPALLVFHLLVLHWRDAFNGATQLIDADEALFPAEESQHSVGLLFPHGILVLGSVNWPGIGPTAAVMDIAHRRVLSSGDCLGSPWPQGLAIAKLNHRPIRVADATVISHGIGLLAWFPYQTPERAGLLGYGIHRRTTFQGKTEVTIIRRRLLPSSPTRHHHHNKFFLSPRLCHPHHTPPRVKAFVDHPHAAEVTVKGYTGVQVTHVQGKMRQDRQHNMPFSRKVLTVMRSRVNCSRQKVNFRHLGDSLRHLLVLLSANLAGLWRSAVLMPDIELYQGSRMVRR